MKHILKQSAVLSILSVLLISLTIPVFAHPGSLDENGGHYDRSTGEYHYHHGYSAHQHENGECPYDFHDNVEHNKIKTKDNSKTDNTASSNKRIKNSFDKTKLIPLFSFLIAASVLLFFITFLLAIYIDFSSYTLTAVRIVLFVFIAVLVIIRAYVLK